MVQIIVFVGLCVLCLFVSLLQSTPHLDLAITSTDEETGSLTDDFQVARRIVSTNILRST
jgi:hypothetical protein